MGKRSVADIVAARLAATGVTQPMAERFGALVAADMYHEGYVVVEATKFNFLTRELSDAMDAIKVLFEAWYRLEKMWPVPTAISAPEKKK